MRVRAYESGDEVAIQQLFKAVFGRERSVEEWRWRFREGPEGPGLTLLLVEPDGTLVGHIGHLRSSIYVRGERLRLGVGADLMVLSGSRGRSGVRLVQESAAAGGFDMRISFPADRAAKLIARFNNSILVGRIPQWVRWRDRGSLEAGRLRPLPAIVRPAAAVGVAAIGVLAGRPRRRLAIEAPSTVGAELASEIDALAEESATYAPCIQVRNAHYVRWRWHENPGQSWEMRIARNARGSLCGFVVFGVGQLRGREGRVGRMVDVLARDPAALRILADQAARELIDRGCGLVTLEYQDPRPEMSRALVRAGFLPRGVGPNFVCTPSPDIDAAARDMGSWYLTLGDTDLA